jgi:peptide/nickel transport system permease protein
MTAVTFIFVLTGLFFTPYDPNGMSAVLKCNGPSLMHPFGCDNMGRDVLSRVMKGASTTFTIGILTAVTGVLFGILIGSITGYFGGMLDEILMRLNDTLSSIPGILMALVFVSLFGTGRYKIIIALGIIFIPSFARIVRSEVIVQKNMDYVRNAKLLGASDFRIIFVHILPNTKKIVLAAFTIGFNNAVLAEAGMSYLSLGVQPPTASLGRMLSESQAYLFSAPWMSLAPGLTIVFAVTGVSLIGNSLKAK